MWFHPIHTILYGFLILAALVRAKDTVAVAFVDVKFDDKVAVWSLLLDDRYSRVVAITSGINAHGQAAEELNEYLDRQNGFQGSKRFNKRKLTILQGTNGLGKKAPHEEWWNGKQGIQIPEANSANLQGLLHGSRVRIYQIAPARWDLVQTVINSADANSIDMYMLLHGYNSGQENVQVQRWFLQNLQSWVTQTNPNAKVYFTSSFDSYPDKGGGKQPYSAIVHMFPQEDLDQAVRDPFWRGQLRKAERDLNMPKISVTDDQLDTAIYLARMEPAQNANWRNYLAEYVQETLNQNSHMEGTSKALDRYRHTLLPEFTGENPVTVELADAGHIAALHRYQDSLKRGPQTPMWMQYIKFDDGSNDPGEKIKMLQGNQWDHHGYLLQGANRDEDLKYIERLAKIR
ncbi:uncharacterized protein SPSC_06664 [Sporisorium scitamineum]|uniref:Uncharacterized protein n=1 Tax=Sporisorium scitamineum TaxID=49012 RepID=A0A0F7S5Z6_9BASI|nr:uncharacterized protein SPSC_06664 [Sporisorium scitamineum]CDW97786.1 hypothetical protein [Sporisorium scitamineum]